MTPGGKVGQGELRGTPPARPPSRTPATEMRGLGRYCIRCNKAFKTDIEKIEHDRILH